MRKHTRIKDIPFSKRPQEKLFKLGSENITLAEILAVLIGTGSLKYSAVQLAENIIREVPDVTASSLEKFLQTINLKGFGKVKKARCLAAIELGRRLYVPASAEKINIKSGQDIIPYLTGINNNHQERMYAFYLNARSELLKKELIAQGTLNIARVSVRDVLGNALISPCASVVIAHNHPSGDASASTDDIIFTDCLQKAAELLNIILIDHLILGSIDYFSFHDNSLHNY